MEEELKKRGLPYLVVFNKWDLVQEKSAGEENSGAEPEDERHIRVSARTGEGIQELKERLARMGSGRKREAPGGRPSGAAGSGGACGSH